MSTMDYMRLRRDNILGGFGNEYDEPIDFGGGGYGQFPESTGINPSGDYLSPQSPPEWPAPIQTTPPQPYQPLGYAPPRDYVAEMMKTMGENYTPETEATDRFNTLLDEYPERNSPSWARRLVASGIGVGAKEDPIGTMEKVMYAPYLRDAAEWKEKAPQYYNAANLERQANVNERQLTGQMAQYGIQQQRADEIERSQREKAAEVTRHNIETEGIAKEKNQIAWAVQNGATANMAGEYVILTYKDGTVVPTQVRTTRFSPIEIANINAASRREVAGIQGANAQALERDRQAGRIEIVDRRGEWGMGTGGGNNSPTELRTVRNNLLRARLDMNPELAEIIKPPATANGDWTITPPEQGMFEGNDAYQARLGPYNQVQTELRQLYTGGQQRQRQQQGGQQQGGEQSLIPNPAAPPPPVQSTPAPGNQPIGGSNVVPPARPFRWTDRNQTGGPTLMDAGRAAYGAITAPPNPNAGQSPWQGGQAIPGMDMTKITPLERRAAVYLQDQTDANGNPIPVTKANIDHAIRTGRVQ